MSIEEIIDTYSDYLYRIAFIYTKDEQAAEEVVQDVLYSYYRKSHQFQGRAQLKTYLTKMAVNRSYDYLRSWKAQKTLIVDAITRKVRPIDQQAVRNEEKQSLLNAVLELPIKYRETILYYYYEDFTVQEIAELLYLPVSTVKSRLQRARAQLKIILQDEEIWEVLSDDQR